MPALIALSKLSAQMASRVTRHRGEMQLVAGAIALGLGFWGWSIEEPAANWSGHANNLFSTLQLVTLNFPKKFDGEITWQLQIARLMVPLVAVLASFHVLVGAVTRPLRLALLPRAQEHIVVFGDTKLTEAALLTLAQRGRQIVVVAPKVTDLRREMLESFGLTAIESDLRQAGALKQLNLRTAAAVFVTGPDDLDNLNIAMLALASVENRPDGQPPLVLAVMIDREDLAIELDEALDGIARHQRLRYHRLCPDREGVRLELARFAPIFTKRDRNAPSHVMVAGLAGRFEQVLSELIVATQDHPSERPILSLVLTAPELKLFEAWRAARPELDLVVRFELLEAETARLPRADALSEWVARCGSPHLVVVMCEDADAIATSLALRRPMNPAGTGNVPLLVRQGREDHVLETLQRTQGQARDLSRMVAFGGLIRADSIERALSRKGDERAIALHERYLAAAQAGGVSTPAALKSWDELSENLREANRSAAEHAPILFAAIGLELVEAAPGIPPRQISADELETLAMVEHRHWMASRIDHGWRYGQVRNDDRQLHPSLLPYEQLTESDKIKDRDTVRVLIEIATAQSEILRERAGAPGPAVA